MKVPLLDLNAQYESIKEELESALLEGARSGRYILGPAVEQLEEKIADFVGVSHAVAVASGTDALLLSLKALGVGAGDEVITSTYSFFASAGVIANAGARPVFVDIDPQTYNLDAGQVERALTERTKVVVPVHLFGQCADMGPIIELSEKHGFSIVEDAAQALGASYGGRKAGSMGAAGCFSFFPSKNLGCFGDGGIVTTNDESLAEAVRVLRVHGSKPKYYHHRIGINSRLDAIQAGVLMAKLPHLKAWNEGRRKNAEWYAANLESPELVHPHCLPGNYHIYNQYVIRVKDRDRLVEHLKEAGIGCAVYYPLPLHLQPCFAYCGYKQGSMPHAEKAAKETVSIPVYAELQEEQRTYVAQAIAEFFDARRSTHAG